MKICVAGQGAFGQKHLDALKRIADVEVTSLVGGNPDATAEIAKKYGIPHYTGDLSEGIKRAEAVILTTPTKMHFRQGEQVMRAGKHVLVEIPVTDSVEDAENLVKITAEEKSDRREGFRRFRVRGLPFALEILLQLLSADIRDLDQPQIREIRRRSLDVALETLEVAVVWLAHRLHPVDVCGAAASALTSSSR